MAAILNLEVRGKHYDVDLTSEGKFRVKLDGADILSATFDGLRDRLVAATRRIQPKQAVEFVLWEENRLRRGVCIGRHANGNYLVKYEGGKTEQARRWELDHAIEPAAAEQYEKLCAESERVQKELKEFERKYRFNVVRKIDAALEGKEGEA